MSNELAVPQREVNPLAILQQAVDKGASIEQITALMGLAERWEANQARKAFNVAFSEFKAEAVTITRNVTVKDGPLKDKAYANLFGVVDAVIPALSKHGLSHSWKLTKDEPTWMEVTCIIRHVLGYSEAVSMGAAPDTGPGRNAIQARGSAKSYLERYTLLAATGLASADEDDDGAGTVTDEQQKVVDLLSKAKTVEELRSQYQAAVKQATNAKNVTLVSLLTKAKDARKKELAGAKAD
jgi:hypothetical protein